MANQAVRVRRDVWSLDEWDDTLLWYARAVELMQGRPLTDPTGWGYQAAVHGRDPLGQDPQFWDQCQHQTWYFLPWHRGYLVCFEQIVQAAIDELRGPSRWALPYWNYSSVDNPNARVLPPAFRAKRTPDGNPNPLLVERHLDVNRGDPISDAFDISVAALDLLKFEADRLGASGGFGGPATGFNHGGGRFGELERVPHGLVHVDIGGLMRNPATAALDPIFWLHHANIDRLWEIWRQDAGHRNPRSSRWRGLRFKLHNAHRRVVTFTAADMLDTTAPALSYRYDNLVDPRGAAVPERVPALAMAVMANNDSVPEMVGATETSVELGATPASATLRVEVPSGPAGEAFALAPGAQPGVFLNVENVVGAQALTNYGVYVNLPADADAADHDELLAGVLPTFGIERASARYDEHGGSGLHATFDITDLVRRQQEEGVWDPGSLRVTFVPRRAHDELPPVTVGRVSLYYKR